MKNILLRINLNLLKIKKRKSLHQDQAKKKRSKINLHQRMLQKEIPKELQVRKQNNPTPVVLEFLLTHLHQKR
jgi:hypothetical protein